MLNNLFSGSLRQAGTIYCMLPGPNKPAAKCMKKIMIACGALVLFAAAANGQTKSRTTTTKNNTTSTVQQNNQSSATPANRVDNPNQVPRAASDIVVPDHAYEPKGTEGVGFFGNGTGGSTMGSTPDNGGTGVTNTMQQGTSGTPARRSSEDAKPQR